jgi:lambda family phage tail tape measure protein
MAVAMLKDIAKLIVQLLIMKPLMDSIKGAFGATPAKNATGNAFAGSIGWPQGVYTTPHFFREPSAPLRRYATGAVFAEAGAEAIMPLKRTKSGNLGVEASGGGMVVNINNTVSQDTQVQVAKNQQPDGQVVLEIMVERKVRQMVSNGSLDNQFRSTYGLTRQPA